MNYEKSEAKAAARAQFRGVWAALTTPFKHDLALDERGLRSDLRHLTRNLKVDGVFCCGTMGEFWALTGEERRRVVEIVVEEARKGGCKVLAHTAHHSAHETVELTRHAQAAGADFAILMNPYYPPMSEDTIYEWFAFVASRVEIGLWMYDARYSGYCMSPELIARLADIENMCGVTLSWGVDHYAQVQKVCGDGAVLSNPNESHLLTMIRNRSAGVSIVADAVSVPDRDVAAAARIRRARARKTLRRSFGRFRSGSSRCASWVHLKWYRNRWQADDKIVPCA